MAKNKIYPSKTVLIYHRIIVKDRKNKKFYKNFNGFYLDIMYNTNWEVKKLTSRGKKEKE